MATPGGDSDPEQDLLRQVLRVDPDRLRGFFRRFNRAMVVCFRLGLGPWISNPYTGYIMVLTTTGRKSGLPRRTPVNYAQREGEVYCLAGFGRRSDWFQNALSDPSVQVWLGNDGWAGSAEVMAGPDQWLPMYREITGRAGFADRAFSRVPYSQMSDEALLKLAGEGPVLLIRLERRLPKAQGPGDLTWLWPVLGFTFLAGWRLGWGRRRKRRA